MSFSTLVSAPVNSVAYGYINRLVVDSGSSQSVIDAVAGAVRRAAGNGGASMVITAPAEMLEAVAGMCDHNLSDAKGREARRVRKATARIRTYTAPVLGAAMLVEAIGSDDPAVVAEVVVTLAEDLGLVTRKAPLATPSA